MRGVSLLEVLLTTLIAGTISVSFMQAITVNQQFGMAQGEQIMALEALRTGLQALSGEASRANLDDLAISNDGQRVTFRIPQDQDGDGSVLDSSGQIEWSSPITYYWASNRKQLRRSQGNEEFILTDGVSQVQFAKEGSSPPVLKIQIQTERKLRGVSSPTQITLRTRVHGRN